MQTRLEEALDALASGGGPRLRAGEPLAGGEVGATAVTGPEGVRFVAKVLPGGAAEGARLRGRMASLEGLRNAGYPRPRYLVVGFFGGHVLAIQEWAGGTQRDDPDEPMVARLVDLAARHADAAPEPGDEFAEWMVGSLREGCDGYCMHRPLHDHSAGTRALLERVRGIGARARVDDFPSHGIAHRDFHHRNVLWKADRVSAVIDWEGAGPGDPTFDLVTLAFGLRSARTSDAARELPWRAARQARPAHVLAAYAAHMALRQVDWSIRHRGPDDVAGWLEFGEFALDRLGS